MSNETPTWAQNISKEAQEQIQELASWLETAFKQNGFDIESSEFRAAFDNILELDPLLFAYTPKDEAQPDTSGEKYYGAVFGAVRAAGYDDVKAQSFVDVLIWSQDKFGKLIAELLPLVASPLPKIPNEKLPPELQEVARGDDLQLWDFNVDEEADSETTTVNLAFAVPAVVIVVPAWVKAVVILSATFAGLFGDKGENNIFKAFAQAVRRVGRKIKRLFRKIFGW